MLGVTSAASVSVMDLLCSSDIVMVKGVEREGEWGEQSKADASRLVA